MIFSCNQGGPLLLLTDQNALANFYQLKIINNTLLSRKGFVELSNCNNASVHFATVMLSFNIIQTDGTTVYCACSISENHDTFSNLENRLSIVNATIENNIGGGHGAGVYISNGYCNGSYAFERITFKNITDINSVIFYSSSECSHNATCLTVKNCIFTGNSATSLYLVNSEVMLEGSIIFERNTGQHGAALYLDLDSKITFNDNSMTIFKENEVLRRGGAIYSNVSIYNCYRNISSFISVPNNNNSHSNVIFQDNVAIIGGNSMYLSVSQSCDELFNAESSIATHPLSDQITTSPKELILYYPAHLSNSTRTEPGSDINHSEYLTYYISDIMLGHDINIPACVFDHNSNPERSVLFSLITIENKQNYTVKGSKLLSVSCTIEGTNSIQIQIAGKLPPKTLNPIIKFQLRSIYDAAYKWKPIVINLIAEISPCHSGFYYDVTSEKCICYTRDDAVSCSGSNATIRRGYWFGFVDEQPTAAVCPLNYCNFGRCEGTSSFCPLLPTIDDQCREHRMGTACGYCQHKYTLPFDSVNCISTSKCTSGYTVLVIMMLSLFWILVIVLVFVMMYFKVGIAYLYSITFYYSVIDILLGQALHTSYALYRTVAIVSSLAKLTPQFLGELCFVEGLSRIDQHAIHYVHPLAVLLILCIIALSTQFSQKLSLFLSRGVIHAICLLLLLSYTSIASTSLLLLRPITFTGVNNKVCTYLSPDLEYFQGCHLVYGLVAIACGLCIVIGLPLLLLLEPFLNHKINFTRIKPLLDQFQGYYKDKYRCLAPFYMICRLVILFIVNTNITSAFTVAYLQLGALVIMTLIHAVARPYISKTLNAFDISILLTMILVAILQPFEVHNGFTSNTIIGLAFTLLVLPLFVFLVLLTPFKSRQRIKECVAHYVAIVKPTERNEVENIEMSNINQEYDLTVDQALRDATATTIA